MASERCKLASGLIEQSPPGEVNDVINDLRAIIADDEALMPHVRESLRAYNLEQLTAVEHAAGVAPSLLSFATLVPGETDRHVDGEGKRSFKFDHITLAVSDYEAYELPPEEQAFRSELAASLAAYTKNHFPGGIFAVSCSQYPIQRAEPQPAEPAEPAEPAVTDVVEEQVAAGDNEPAPTPIGVGQPRPDVVSPGGLEAGEGAAEPVDKGADASEPGNNEGNGGVTAGETEITPSAEGQAVESEPVVAAPVYTLEVVGNRYKPSNFWTGRWRTRWVVDQAAGTVSGVINVDVHYYEQGNVQLATVHTASFPCPVQANGSQSIASQIVTAIAKVETSYQLELNDVYDDLGDKAFRALRRALPVTRQKMDWDKVGGYSLGSDLKRG